MKVSKEGLALIQKFEGLRLDAYYDVVGVLTIGYGHTGSDVTPDLKITKERALEFLKWDCESAEQCINSFVNTKLNQNEFDALVSFIYNLGPTSFINSTLLKLLNEGTSRSTVAAEFPRWVRADGKVLQGLVSRRNAEKALFLTQPKHPLLSHSILAKQDTWLKRKPVDSSALKAEEKLFVPKGSAWQWDEIRIYPGESHQRVFLTPKPEQEWWFFPAHWKLINDSESFDAVDTPPAVVPSTSEIKLKVPYYSQRDNYRDALRTCFSSSCAMLLSALKPGSIKGDDDYLKTVFKYGDTTEAWVQLKALAEYGVDASFKQNGSWDSLEAQLKKGIPVPIGILHKGPISAPTGGGHWLVVIGLTADKKSVIVNDPFGDLDLVGGTYLNKSGAGLIYSKKNLGPRWLVEGENSGWLIAACK
jgi:GH24 family phage-related lysozyme (muramidase)